MKDVEGVQFLQWCLPRLQLCWPGYRKVRRQVYKRIQRRLESLGLASLADYQTYLETHPEEWAVLDSSCWIPISQFYREKSVFLFLEHDVVPHLAKQIYGNGGEALRCWSLGCASGEEPYSLSLLWRLKLQTEFPTVRLVILATDIDKQPVARAQRGCYPLSSLRDLPETWRTQGFDQTAEGLDQAGVSAICDLCRAGHPASGARGNLSPDPVPVLTLHLLRCTVPKQNAATDRGTDANRRCLRRRKS